MNQLVTIKCSAGENSMLVLDMCVDAAIYHQPISRKIGPSLHTFAGII